MSVTLQEMDTYGHQTGSLENHRLKMPFFGVFLLVPWRVFFFKFFFFSGPDFGCNIPNFNSGEVLLTVRIFKIFSK